MFSGLCGFTELEQRIASLPDEKSRGDAFEVFAEAYLATQRKHDAEVVWPFPSVPNDLLTLLKLGTQDFGIDGVLKTRLGDHSVYQVKFRTGRPSLTWRELSTFMGLADSPNIRSRILFTNCDELPSVLNERQGFFCIRGSDLDRLEANDFRAIEAWLGDATFITSKKQPQPHQTEALNALLPSLEKHDRVSAIMACGTGKTLVALWIAERIQAARILVLLPSLALLRQTLHEWLHETKLPNLAYLCICSDSTVKEGIDALETQQSDLDFQVSTDVQTVRDFLDAPFIGTKIIFSTYQSAQVVGAALKVGESFDFAVFDEAHKTAGREGRNYGFALEDANILIRKRLFVTATPRHYSPPSNSKESGAKLVFSMDKPEVYGPIVYRLPFSEAAKRGIITDYKVIISEVTSEMVNDELLRRGIVLVEGEEIKARQVANQIALKSAIEKYNVSKIFTFHSRVDAAKSFTSDGAAGISTHLQGFHCEHIEGAMPTAYRERVMRVFKSASHAILSNARCLTEGVDVPAVDMVAFLAPRRSVVDIVQATGRAMRRSPGKQFGYVLVPLYVEKSRGETIEQAVLRSNFDEIWKVLQALKEQDDILSQIIDDMRIQRGRTGGFDESRFRERVEMIGPEISLDSLRHSITAACLDAIGEGWFERYGQLLAYQQKHGSCDMPARYRENKKLATWVVNQRVLQRDGVLEEEKIALLDRIGFKWNPHESTWRTQYLALLDYRKQFDHCRVPQNWKENKALAKWVGSQRVEYGRGKLNRQRVAMLEKIGFEWIVLSRSWMERLAELKTFKLKNGHTRVPAHFPENQKLAVWVVRQRFRKRKNKLTSDQIRLIDELGFEWEVQRAIHPAQDSRPRIEALLAHKAEHGHWSVSRQDKKYSGLASWMTDQRARLKNGTISEELKQQLDEIGFPWKPIRADTKNQWLEMFEHFKKYASAHGASSVRIVDDKTAKLNRWMLTQRRMMKSGKLDESRLKLLNEIGFAWQRVKKKPVLKPTPVPSVPEIPPLSWDEMFSELANFYKLKGHCNVPVDWQANPELAQWVHLQRVAKRRNRLTADQTRRMSEIGFAWSVHDGDWDSMFAKLAEQLRPMHNGKPRDSILSSELRSWIITQRQFKKRGELDVKREHKLNSIGFEWQPFSKKWEQKFVELRRFHSENKHCRVPTKWPENPKLASWVAVQRARKSTGKLSDERIAALDKIGFEWILERRILPTSGNQRGNMLTAAKSWDAMFLELQAYQQAHGNCLVPQGWKENRKLANWVSEQREINNQGRLDPELCRQLDGLGFDWDPNNTHWEKYFRQLVEFKEKYDHTNVSQRSGRYKALGTWVRNQRAAKRYKRPVMLERAKRLDEIGFIWNLIEPMSWEKMFAALVEYKKVRGHCNVPQLSREHKRLGKWVNTQRTQRKRGKLRADRERQLEELGFVWNVRPVAK